MINDFLPRTKHFIWFLFTLWLGTWGPISHAQNLAFVNKIVANDGTANDFFGENVAISGDQAIVGAYQDDNFTGAAYIFQKDGLGNWVQVQKLTIADGESPDQFGRGVAIDGDQAIVGAINDDGTGASYIFQKNTSGMWEQVQKLMPSNSESLLFGFSNVIHGDEAMVGAYGSDEVYVFRKDGNGLWSEVQRLTPIGGSQKAFGVNVVFDGNLAIIGANQDQNFAGSAYIFQKNNVGSWVEVQKLGASDANELDQFGFGVAISGSQVLVGAYGNNDSAGAVYVFQENGSGVWTQLQKLVASTATQLLGLSISVSGDQALFGAYGDDEVAINAGAAFRFTKDGSGMWSQAQKITAGDGAPNDLFGYGVAIDGNQAIIGAFGDNSSQGSAYTYLAACSAYTATLSGTTTIQQGSSANLSVSIIGGTAPYTVVYSNGNTSTTITNYHSGANISVSPTTTTTYTLVSVTDADECSATASGTAVVTVEGQDFSCGPDRKNVLICYYGTTQCVSEKTAERYLKLGATMGPCGSGRARTAYEPETKLLTLSLDAFPNPMQDAMTVEVISPVAGTATFEVLDLTGRARQSRRQQLAEGLNQIEFRLGTLPAGTYLIRCVVAAGQQATVRVHKE